MGRDLLKLLAATIIGVTALAGYAAFRIYDQGRHDERRSSDAIVVLGAAQYDGRPSPVFKARLEHAVELYQAGLGRYLVVTGGKAPGDRTTEAAVARRFAEDRGVPAEAILDEDRGRTTVESLRAVRRLFDSNHLESALFVSDRTHMLRVLRIADDLGMRGWGSPTPNSPTDAQSRRRMDAMVHELGALALYFVSGQAPAGELTGPAAGGG